jgi:hypothetical protein
MLKPNLTEIELQERVQLKEIKFKNRNNLLINKKIGNSQKILIRQKLQSETNLRRYNHHLSKSLSPQRSEIFQSLSFSKNTITILLM